jgi:hypothetical protein
MASYCIELPGYVMCYCPIELFLFCVHFLIDRFCQEAYIAQVFCGKRKRERKTSKVYSREVLMGYIVRSER